MELEKAIELLKTVSGNEYVATTDYESALNIVLAELDRKDEEIKNYQNTIEVIEDLGRKKIGEIVEKALKGEE